MRSEGALDASTLVNEASNKATSSSPKTLMVSLDMPTGTKGLDQERWFAVDKLRRYTTSFKQGYCDRFLKKKRKEKSYQKKKKKKEGNWQIAWSDGIN